MDHRNLVNKVKHPSAKKVVFISFIIDVLDIALNLVIAIFSGSIVMLTQVLDGISDVISSGLLLIGIKRSVQKPNRAHPFGYGREMYFWALLAALVMFAVTATLSFFLGYQRFVNPQPLKGTLAALLVLLVTILTNGYAFYLSYTRLLQGRSVKKVISAFYGSSLIETKTTFILDLMGTLSSVFGIVSLGIYFITGNDRWDGIGAMTIGVILAVLAFILLVGIWDLLVGKSASPYMHTKIKNAALNIPEVKDVLGIKTLYMGPNKLLVHLDVHMKSSLTTRELEKLMDKIKANIRYEVPEVKNIQVELETPDK